MSITLTRTAATSIASPFASPSGAWLRSGLARAQALWSALRSPVATRPLTALEQADRVRAKADKLLAADPVFAQELYAAADRHEYAHAPRA